MNERPKRADHGHHLVVLALASSRPRTNCAPPNSMAGPNTVLNRSANRGRSREPSRRNLFEPFRGRTFSGTDGVSPNARRVHPGADSDMASPHG